MNKKTILIGSLALFTATNIYSCKNTKGGDSTEKSSEMKCGEGKCGGKKDTVKMSEGKCGEGKCGDKKK